MNARVVTGLAATALAVVSICILFNLQARPFSAAMLSTGTVQAELPLAAIAAAP